MISQFVLTPSKHIRFDRSLLYIAGIIRQRLKNKAITIDELYFLLKAEFCKKDKTPPTFIEIVFAIDLLFALYQVDLSDNGKVILIGKGGTE